MLSECKIVSCQNRFYIYKVLALAVVVLSLTGIVFVMDQDVQQFRIPFLFNKTLLSKEHTTRITTPAPHVVQKLKTIFQQMNKTNVESINFPPEQIGKYLMLNPNICRDAPHINIVIIVHTAPGNFAKRNRMRRTFANSKLYLPYQIRIAFLLGKPKQEKLQKALESEHAQYNDTIMGDYFDDYHNLTLKGVMGFHWVSEYCANSDFVLKLDDDVIVDVYKLLHMFKDDLHGKRKSLFCNFWRKNMGIMRKGKWKVPHHVFYKKKVFPYFYCSGFTVLMTSDLMAPLYRAAKMTPFFWIDDVYLFGMLPKVVGGVTYHQYELGKNLSWSGKHLSGCLKNFGESCAYFSSLVNEEEYNSTWKQIQVTHSKKLNWTARSAFEP